MNKKYVLKDPCDEEIDTFETFQDAKLAAESAVDDGRMGFDYQIINLDTGEDVTENDPWSFQEGEDDE
ncbi:hypothetical protein [Schleiferilactobacillus shenzhenensis]|uniref:Uncharacterized protein n=1 Tax=Schleiferilactobacillus shenzhenensis LY-73 TaxID=1231336 RepID=U4TKW6_9LACO|nr:hypothetical protein [Schleiferilactobacillus shenzhenensis]ERL64030.1 hypothetical protein L248_1677 [Schleiferilactobacillus shenzhenensis LY-73]